jgi:DNA-binding NarL/FixJ family response regulator
MLAHAFAGDRAAAEIFAAALEDITVPIPTSLIVEIIHARASMMWACGDLAQVDRELARCKPHRDLRSQARHLQLTAAIAGRREDYARQADILCEALDVIGADKNPEIPLQTTLLRSLCIALREIIGAQHQIEYAAELYRKIPWTPELSADHVVCALHLGWIRALSGDQLGALRYVQDAFTSAERPAWMVATLTDRSAIKMATGESSSALLELEQCLSLAEKIDWQETPDEERLYLITLAELAGPINPPRAQALLLRSNILARGGNMRLAYHQNRRIQAMAHHASGVIAHAAGDAKLARASLKIAYETFSELKCVSRATESALMLHKVTGDESWLRTATEGARAYPRSWLAQATRAIAGEEQDTAYSRLTPKQREVFKLMLEGLTVAKIADSIGSRPNTVRNHVKGVYNSFGVGSHTELLVEARRRRLA